MEAEATVSSSTSYELTDWETKFTNDITAAFFQTKGKRTVRSTAMIALGVFLGVAAALPTFSRLNVTKYVFGIAGIMIVAGLIIKIYLKVLSGFIEDPRVQRKTCESIERDCKNKKLSYLEASEAYQNNVFWLYEALSTEKFNALFFDQDAEDLSFDEFFVRHGQSSSFMLSKTNRQFLRNKLDLGTIQSLQDISDLIGDFVFTSKLLTCEMPLIENLVRLEFDKARNDRHNAFLLLMTSASPDMRDEYEKSNAAKEN